MFYYRLRVIDRPMSEIQILSLCRKKSILVDIYRQSLFKSSLNSGCPAYKFCATSRDQKPCLEKYDLLGISLAVMPTLPLLAGDLRSFSSSPTLPLCYINLPLFTSTINIEYLVKNKTDLV